MAGQTSKFNLLDEINSTFRGRTSAVTNKPTSAEAFIPVEPKKKRLGSFFMSMLSSDEEAEYEPEQPFKEFDFKASEAKWAVINKARLWAPRFGPYYNWKIDFNMKTRGVEAASETLEIAISEALRDEAIKAGTYPPPPPGKQIEQKLNLKREPAKENGERNPKRKLDEATEKELFGDRLEKIELEREISELNSKIFLINF